MKQKQTNILILSLLDLSDDLNIILKQKIATIKEIFKDEYIRF